MKNRRNFLKLFGLGLGAATAAPAIAAIPMGSSPAPPTGKKFRDPTTDPGKELKIPAIAAGYGNPKRIEDERWYTLNNAVPIKPWAWATLPLKKDPVEIVSYPWYEDEATPPRWRVNVRMKVGDPTSLRAIDARAVGCFHPSSHEDFYREKIYYSDNPTAFHFADELPPGVFRFIS